MDCCSGWLGVRARLRHKPRGSRLAVILSSGTNAPGEYRLNRSLHVLEIPTLTLLCRASMTHITRRHGVSLRFVAHIYLLRALNEHLLLLPSQSPSSRMRRSYLGRVIGQALLSLTGFVRSPIHCMEQPSMRVPFVALRGERLS